MAEKGLSMVPALRSVEPLDSYAGIRPATQFRDYQIEVLKDKHWVTVGGIRSTGLSAAVSVNLPSPR